MFRSEVAMKVETRINGAVSIMLMPENGLAAVKEIECEVLAQVRSAIESGQAVSIEAPPEGGIAVVLRDK